MTPPKEDGDKGASKRRPPPPLWRLAFDAIERPIGAASEAWVQTDVFMDALSVTWKAQRRLAREMNRGLGMWMGLWDVPGPRQRPAATTRKVSANGGSR